MHTALPLMDLGIDSRHNNCRTSTEFRFFFIGEFPPEAYTPPPQPDQPPQRVEEEEDLPRAGSFDNFLQVGQAVAPPKASAAAADGAPPVAGDDSGNSGNGGVSVGMDERPGPGRELSEEEVADAFEEMLRREAEAESSVVTHGAPIEGARQVCSYSRNAGGDTSAGASKGSPRAAGHGAALLRRND